MKPKHERPHSVPFKINSIKSEHETRCQLKFKNKKKPPKYQRAKKEEETIPDGQEVGSQLDQFTEERNKDSAQRVRQQQQQKSQKQEMQQTAEDHNKAQKEAKRKNEAELQKLADKMGEGAAFRAGDQKARQRVRKRKIAQEGGGETVKGGIAFSDGSALFVSPNISGEDFTNMRKMVRGIK